MLMLCPSVIYRVPWQIEWAKILYCMLCMKYCITCLISAAGAMNPFYFVNFKEVVISLRCKQSKDHFKCLKGIYLVIKITSPDPCCCLLCKKEWYLLLPVILFHLQATATIYK